MRFAVLFLACLTAAPASAVDAPAGCTAFLTVQNRDCEVDVYFRCDTADGMRHRIQNYSPEGLDAIEEATADWSLLYSIDPPGQSGIVVRDGPASPISVAQMLATGRTEFDYPIDFYFRSPDPLPTRLTGTFRKSSSETVIDGQTLVVLESRMTIELPASNSIETIQQSFFSESLGAFFEGPGSLRVGDQVIDVDARPERFFVPGDAEFLDVTPRFGCSSQGAAWTVVP